MLFLIYTFHPLPPEASWKGQETDDVLSVGTLLRADLQSGRKTAEDHMKALINLDLLFSFVCLSVHTHASAHECRKVQVSLSVVPQELSTSFLGGGEERIPHRDLGLPSGVGWLASELWAPPPSPKPWGFKCAHSHPELFTSVLWIKARSWHLCSKRFTD